MPEVNVAETLEMVGKAKTREEKRQILKDRDNFATKALLQLNFHPDAKWKIPPANPPYIPNENTSDASLHFEVKKLNYYSDPSPHNLPMIKREGMFVQLLERTIILTCLLKLVEFFLIMQMQILELFPMDMQKWVYWVFLFLLLCY